MHKGVMQNNQNQNPSLLFFDVDLYHSLGQINILSVIIYTSRMQNNHISFFRCTEFYMLSFLQIPCVTPISKLYHFNSITVAKGRMVSWSGLKHSQRLQQNGCVLKNNSRLQVHTCTLDVFPFRSALRGMAHACDNRL